MNGVFNFVAGLLIAAGLLGGAVIMSDRQNPETVSENEQEAFKAEVRQDVSEELAGTCDEADAECDNAEVQVTELEQPYAPGVAVSTGDGAETTTTEQTSGEQPTAVSSDSFTAAKPTAVLGASFGGDDDENAETQPADKPDSDEDITENRTLRGPETETAPEAEQTVEPQVVDKPDSQEYFTENRRTDGTPIDKPDSEQYFTENRRTDGTPVDKPDDSTYFTENKPMDDPCIRDDGTRYTGPGTASDPFAEGDPCLVEVQVAQSTAPVDKPDSNQYFTEDRRIDGTPVDKPDDGDYFTEFKSFDDPCVYDDGTRYSGPGTVKDPSAPGDPCATEEYVITKIPPYVPEEFSDPCEEGRRMPEVNEFLQESDPCVTDTRTPPPKIVQPLPEPEPDGDIPPPPPPPVLAWSSPYQDPGPDFPRTTLGPRGSDYPMQVTMVYDPYHP